jgi:hypothetical protein
MPGPTGDQKSTKTSMAGPPGKPRGVEQRPSPGRPGEPACGQIRGIEDVERCHGCPGRRTMNASIWSDMFYRRCRSWKRSSGRSSSTVERGEKKGRAGAAASRRHWSLGPAAAEGREQSVGMDY